MRANLSACVRASVRVCMFMCIRVYVCIAVEHEPLRSWGFVWHRRLPVDILYIYIYYIFGIEIQKERRVVRRCGERVSGGAMDSRYGVKRVGGGSTTFRVGNHSACTS